MQGVSLVPLLKGQHPKDWRDAIYYHFYEYPAEHMVKRHYGVSDGRYKLMHFYNDIDQWEMYDLQNDPNEMNNLFGNPEYADLQKRMLGILKAKQVEYDDPIRFKYPIAD